MFARKLGEWGIGPSHQVVVYDAGDGGGLSADQFTRLKQELTETFSGHGNAGRPMLLEGGLSWQSMSLSPADMDFAALKAAAARDVALAYQPNQN